MKVKALAYCGCGLSTITPEFFVKKEHIDLFTECVSNASKQSPEYKPLARFPLWKTEDNDGEASEAHVVKCKLCGHRSNAVSIQRRHWYTKDINGNKTGQKFIIYSI